MSIENLTKHNVIVITSDISDILLQSAKATLGAINRKSKSQNSNKKNDKDWLNADCHKAK